MLVKLQTSFMGILPVMIGILFYWLLRLQLLSTYFLSLTWLGPWQIQCCISWLLFLCISLGLFRLPQAQRFLSITQKCLGCERTITRLDVSSLTHDKKELFPQRTSFSIVQHCSFCTPHHPSPHPQRPKIMSCNFAAADTAQAVSEVGPMANPGSRLG